MASPKSKLSIHAARMNCLAGCFESQTPLTFLLEFQEKLRSLGWQDADIEMVAASVLPLLVKDASGPVHESHEVRMNAS